MNKPHKHAALIKAWADGAEIQWKGKWNKDGDWLNILSMPLWDDDNYEYRIKPEREYPTTSLNNAELCIIYNHNLNGNSYNAHRAVADAAIKRYIQEQESINTPERKD